MNRRAGLGAILAASAAAVFGVLSPARAEGIARMGFIHADSPDKDPVAVKAFWLRLRELGWIEGQNLLVVSRIADGQNGNLSKLVTEIAQSKVDVICTSSAPVALAAKEATSKIPIVATAVGDPVGTGVIRSMARPEGNVTGVSLGSNDELSAKFLELLQEVIPGLSTVAVISDPDSVSNRLTIQALEGRGSRTRLQLRFIHLKHLSDLDRVFALVQRKAQAAIVLSSPLTVTHRSAVTSMASRYHVPTIYPMAEFVDAGGLLAYYPDQVVMFRRAAEYVDKILKGTSPKDLPFEQPSRFLLSLNLTAARALGLKIPDSMLMRANRVIQ
jgi:putative ABC transport system substrate-binding protein